jgi:hypothetical protein
MLNLQSISKDTYKELGFKNRTRGIVFNMGVLNTKVTKYKTVQQLTNHIKSKINHISSLGIDINDKKNSGIYKAMKL